MDTNTHYWGEFFSRWPADLPRHGIVVTTFNEQIMFSSFWTGENLMMFERQTPDAIGARSVVLPYTQILGVKIVEIIKPKHIKSAGFEGAAPKSLGGTLKTDSESAAQTG
jgi:hypothetical protein